MNIKFSINTKFTMNMKYILRNIGAFLLTFILIFLCCTNFKSQIVFAKKQETLIRKAYQPLSKISKNRYILEDDGVYRKKMSEDELILLSGKDEPMDIAKSATVMITGDLMCLRAQQYGAKSKSTYVFNDSFSFVKQIFSNSDLVIGNLETLTSHSNYYTYEQKTIEGSPNCNAPGTFLDALRYAGFDAVVTANNHCLDGGMAGIRETIEKLQEYHIAQVGTYLGNDLPRFLIYEVNGIKIGVLSYTEYINFRQSLSANDLNNFVNCYSKASVERDVKEAKKAGAEFVIAYNHWGIENTTEITNLQKQHAKEMAEAGVDVIIGSHPHCLQEAVYIKTSDKRQVLCMYSMGNFVSSMATEANNDTIILRLLVSKEDGKVTLKQSGYYPLKVFPVYENKHYVIVPTQKEFQKGNTTTALEKAGKRIKNVLGTTIKEWKVKESK
ncbi:CapA family protein [Lachnoclostridium phytofermentans]|nr:CapA family protein [Lachnoclostridium phytofermentans]